MAPGIHLDAQDLLALRDEVYGAARHRPATRRAGVAPSRLPGSGMDLREIRAYVPGDDPRRLDPSATARTGRPHVRALHEDRDDIALLIADFRPAMLWGTGARLRSVLAARHLARTGWQAVAQQGAVGLVAMAAGQVFSIPPAAGDAQMAAICAMMADRHRAALDDPRLQIPLSEALALAARIAPPGARITLATAPDGCEGADAMLTRLARGRRLEVALMLDPLDVSPPDRALPVTLGARPLVARLAPVDLGDRIARLAAMGATSLKVAP
nr:DUF58 domain-containing protein [Paracoccus saliphilus]